jgi:hypothetical protein
LLPREEWASGGALGVVALQFALVWPAEDRSAEFTVRNYGLSVLENVPENAWILTRGDLNHNVLTYLRVCEGNRPDVVLLDLELMTMPWMNPRIESDYPEIFVPGTHYHLREPGGYSLREFLRSNAGNRIYVCGGLKSGDNTLGDEFESWPVGFCEQLTPRNRRTQATDGKRLLSMSYAERTAVVPPSFWMRRSNAETARAGGFKNLGIALARLSPYDPAYRVEMAEAWGRYLADAPSDDPDLPRIRTVLEQFELDLRGM